MRPPARVPFMGADMKSLIAGSLGAMSLAVTLAVSNVGAQQPAAPATTPPPPKPAALPHLEAARKAAGTDFFPVVDRACGEAVPGAPGFKGRTPSEDREADRAGWHVEPQKVFDNLYFVGQHEYSAWAVTTSAGIVIIDTIFDYSVEDEVVNGLKKLGFDPATIRYAIVSHGHGDHSGGAKYLQDHFGTRVILTAEDWDLLDRSPGVKPKRDMVATDGMKLTLGDTTITMHTTPGHTLGTLSTIIPVKDNGVPHVAANWGGTAFNWMPASPAYITPERPAKFWFETYSASARKFKAIAAQAGADVVIANHTKFDGSRTKLAMVAARQPGEPNPYIVGKEGVQRYLTAAEECALAGLAQLN